MGRYLYITLMVLFIPVLSCAGKCTGADNCTACGDCSQCGYCNSGGSCGVCANRNIPIVTYPPLSSDDILQYKKTQDSLTYLQNREKELQKNKTSEGGDTGGWIMMTIIALLAVTGILVGIYNGFKKVRDWISNREPDQ